MAVLDPADDADEHTQPREETDISIVATEAVGAVGRRHRPPRRGRRCSTTWWRTSASGPRPTRCSRSCPSTSRPASSPTRACWYTVPLETLLAAGLEPSRIIGAVHAAEHALIGLLPLFAICDRWDVGGVSMALHPQTGDPTIFVYDGYPGGAGIAELAFAELTRHVRAAHELVAGCPCDDGCPSCVQSPKCGNWNEYLDKGAAIVRARGARRGRITSDIPGHRPHLPLDSAA